jgi:GTP-binding protein Era
MNAVDDNQTALRCGFVSIIGAPNAGKSTLLNKIVGTKVSIVTSKVQTTRTTVKGIVVNGQSQIIFIDTPGVFEPKKRLERAMVSLARESTIEADLVLLLVDISKKNVVSSVKKTIEHVLDKNVKVMLVLNKIDKVNNQKLLSLSKEINDLYDFERTFMISALKEDGVSDLLNIVSDYMPSGPWFYPEDQISDMPMRLLAAEITREKLFQKLHQEIPYGLTVETESWEEFDNGSIKIDQVIIVGKNSHKPIVLGKKGSMIKQVGQLSRAELEDMLETRVHLKLFVKVRERWEEDPERYGIWGLDHSS